MRGARHWRSSDLLWDCQTEFWPSATFHDLEVSGSDLWMLADDLRLELWSHFHRLSRAGNRGTPEPIRLERCSPTLAAVFDDFLPNTHGHGNGVAETLDDFIPMTAAGIVLNESVTFELCYARPANAPGEPIVAATLRYVPTRSIFGLGRARFQIVPPQSDKRDGRLRVLRVQRERLIRFEAPRKWRSALRRIRRALPVLTRVTHSWISDGLSSRPDEEFSVARRRHDVALARATRDLGWNGRGQFRDHMADFHATVRELRWKRFCITMRDHLLATVQGLFLKVGRSFGEAPLLVVEGLPSADQVLAAESHLSSGGTPFESLLKEFR